MRIPAGWLENVDAVAQGILAQSVDVQQRVASGGWDALQGLQHGSRLGRDHPGDFDRGRGVAEEPSRPSLRDLMAPGFVSGVGLGEGEVDKLR